MPATAKPVAAYEASVMCSVCWKAIGFSMAAIGSTWASCPFTTSKPVGAFIQAFAITTKMPDSGAAHRDEDAGPEWARGEIRSQP